MFGLWEVLGNGDAGAERPGRAGAQRGQHGVGVPVRRGGDAAGRMGPTLAGTPAPATSTSCARMSLVWATASAERKVRDAMVCTGGRRHTQALESHRRGK